ncbi:hypothetical protein DAPPUDRAFT_329721 [Daphnia pulex]|uniref:SBNO alpha/beta domain-containing protein n=1 Tax=Daphnia pulex TaxID=6669 RepID=E9HHF3_DAPPU|nr:hypothetical protein DAPPUDRAFT_331093 [Daphnia pulex]EFX68857.1 hypothetical protein DAPPUDRAFT_329721 [Daphnia pulex]|eukprot:EFX67437.1 hypothetical protein DAPPUDRAFT_331093 [Daphnia pulex]
MGWKLARDMSASLSGNSEGFYISNLTQKGKRSVFLVVNNKQSWEVFKISHEKVAADSPQRRVVEKFGNLLYNASKTDCYHRYWTGLSLKTLNFQCGPIFSAWKEISSVIKSMQVVPVKFLIFNKWV